MAQATQVESAVSAVADTLPQAIVGETCDKCGPSVLAFHMATKGDFKLFFCQHDARESAAKLISTGFTITPDIRSL